MKKFILAIFLLGLLDSNVGFSVPKDDIFSYEVITRSENGNAFNELLYLDSGNAGDHEIFPSSMSILPTGNVIIIDSANNRFVYFDSDNRAYKIVEIIPEGYLWEPHTFSRYDDLSILSSITERTISGIDNRGRYQFKTRKINDSESFIYHNNYLFQFDRKERIFCILKPVLDDKMNQINILDAEGIRNYLKTHAKEEDVDFSIDNKNRLVINNKLLSQNHGTYFKWWNDYYKKQGIEYNAKINLGEYLSDYSDEWYLGEDGSQKTYWCGQTYIIIHDKDAMYLIGFNYFDYKAMGRKTMYPALHPSGDIYYLAQEKNQKLELRRIRNVWDPDGRAKWYKEKGNERDKKINHAAIICKENTAYKSLVDKASEAVGELNKNDRVVIIEKSKKTEKIGNITSYWYKIQTEKGDIGWIFGGYLEIQ